MNLWTGNPVLRGAVYALAGAALIAIGFWMSHRSALRAAADTTSAVTSVPESSREAVHPRLNEHMILALCHPELTPNNSSPPNFDVSRAPKPFAVSFKVRFWVNGYGFVTRAFALGGNVDDAGNQEAALHYTKGLIFQVPDTDECHAREMEISGEFHESADAGGQWVTVMEMHPRYTNQDGQLVERP
jgi:hypothetical protein